MLTLDNPDKGSYEVINVLLSNAGTAFPLVPIIANPEKAHRGAENRDEIFRMIIDGADQKSAFDP